MKARDIMSNDVVTVTPSMDLERLLVLFREQRITGAPVVDDERRLVGIVSKDDVLYRRERREEQSGPLDVEQLFRGGFAALGGEARRARTVSEVMTRDVVAAAPDDPVQEVCRRLWERRIHRLPIVESGRLVGLVSVLDVCRAVAEERLRP